MCGLRLMTSHGADPAWSREEGEPLEEVSSHMASGKRGEFHYLRTNVLRGWIATYGWNRRLWRSSGFMRDGLSHLRGERWMLVRLIRYRRQPITARILPCVGRELRFQVWRQTQLELLISRAGESPPGRPLHGLQLHRYASRQLVSV